MEDKFSNTSRIVNQIAKELSISEKQVQNTIGLLENGNTVPFISRYRKEITGSLDEVKIREIQKRFLYLSELEERKKVVLKTIEAAGKLTDELRGQVEECMRKQELEDLYLPYRPKRRTKATIAIESGLLPLAEVMLKQEIQHGTPQKHAMSFVNPRKNVHTTADALQGAKYIIAEHISEDAQVRGWIRNYTFENGQLATKATREYAMQRSKYEMYYEYSENIKRIPSHRALAINRAEREKVVSVKVEVPLTAILQYIQRKYIKSGKSPFTAILEDAIADSYNRLIAPSIGNEIRAQITERAEDVAIKVFAKNLRNLLLQPPAGEKTVLGIDPGIRTGSKAVLIDKTGKVLESTTIYPPTHRDETVIQDATLEAKTTLSNLIKTHSVEIIAIGNGTGSREIDQFVREVLEEASIAEIHKVTVNESGASVYSASELAREELPELDVSLRGAVSIARRVQDPLAELVKIDPKSIGVGQYQHDVDQKKLSETLRAEVESAVNFVGVNLNTASSPLLSYVSGIGPALARNIIQLRDENGQFKNREQLLQVPKFGPMTFQQAAGFLRIPGGDNSLDNSAVHPESYCVVESISSRLNVNVDELMGNGELISVLRPSELVSDSVGLPTIEDIIAELRKPGRDPRESYSHVQFEPGVVDIKDLKVGMVLNGIATNVTHFGVFVDIGVHQDGLVHISELSNRYIRDPNQACRVGDKVQVKVISVDVERQRIGLSVKQLGRRY